MPSVLLTAAIFAVQFAFMAIMVPLGIAASYVAPKRLFLALVRIWARGLFVLMGKRLPIIGRERIPKNRFMIITNHASLYDIPAIMAVFPGVAWLGRDYLLRIPLFSRMLKRMNYIGVQRDPSKSGRRILRDAVNSAGKFTIALFPEGTRSLDGSLGRFKRGFVHIMRAAELDVLPVALVGMFDLKPKNRFSIRPQTPIRVVIGELLSFADLEPLSNEEILAIVEQGLRRTLEEGYKTSTSLQKAAAA